MPKRGPGFRRDDGLEGGDHPADWLHGTGEMPEWLGYTLGRRMVDRYIARYPDATALGLVHAEAGEFAFTPRHGF